MLIRACSVFAILCSVVTASENLPDSITTSTNDAVDLELQPDNSLLNEITPPNSPSSLDTTTTDSSFPNLPSQPTMTPEINFYSDKYIPQNPYIPLDTSLINILRDSNTH